MVKNSIVDLGNSIINGIQSINEYLFVPSDNLFDDVQQMFNSKFGFVNQVIDIVKSFTFSDSNSKPIFKITLYGQTMNFVDFSIFDDYRLYIHNIIVVIAYFKYFIWLINNAPAIITGTGSALSQKEVE